MARCANSGISLGVDPRGRRIGETELFTRAVSVVELPIVQEKTLYVRFGEWISVLAGLQAAVLGGWALFGKRTRKES